MWTDHGWVRVPVPVAGAKGPGAVTAGVATAITDRNMTDARIVAAVGVISKAVTAATIPSLNLATAPRPVTVPSPAMFLSLVMVPSLGMLLSLAMGPSLVMSRAAATAT